MKCTTYLESGPPKLSYLAPLVASFPASTGMIFNFLMSC